MSAAEAPGRPPELWMLPCVECEQPMSGGQQRLTFDGDWSIVEIRFECRTSGCQTEATVTYRTFIPRDIAQAREDRQP